MTMSSRIEFQLYGWQLGIQFPYNDQKLLVQDLDSKTEEEEEDPAFYIRLKWEEWVAVILKSAQYPIRTQLITNESAAGMFS